MNNKSNFIIVNLFYLIFLIFTFSNSYSADLQNCANSEGCTINKNSCSGDGYLYNINSNSYNNVTRTICTDKDLSSFDSDVTETISKISSIPVIGQVLNIAELVLPYVYFGQATNLAVKSSISMNVDTATQILLFFTNMLGIFDSSSEDSIGFVAFSQVYNTNQYCQLQAFYNEENKYITRQEASSVGGYPLYPIYPLDVSIVNNQCNYYQTVENSFLLPGGSIDGGFMGYSTNATKCSYAYSSTRAQCLDLDIPILSTYTAFAITAESSCIVCTAKNPDKVAKSTEKISKLRKFYETVKKVANVAYQTLKIGSQVATMFIDPRLVYDPISLKYVFDFEYGITMVVGVFDYFTSDIASAITCFVARYAVLTATKTALTGVQEDQIRSNYNDAKIGLSHIRFCGQDWLSYESTSDGKYYVKGGYTNSRYKAVNDCINQSNQSGYNNECNKIKDSEVVCKEDSDPGFCVGINKRTKDIRNKIYREYLYSGKEYESSIVEKTIETNIDDNRNRAITYDTDYCIDPRLPRTKGYYSLMQRYYMRGNDKANFACNRFFYDGVSGCILPTKDIEDTIQSIKNEVKNGVLSSNDEKYEIINNVYNIIQEYNGVINYDNSNTFYIIDKNQNESIFNIFNDKCNNAFTKARECCKYRSQHMFCLESIKGEEANSGSTKYLNNIEVTNSSFCFSNVINNYSSSVTTKSTIVDYLKNINEDASKITCEIKDYRDKTYYFEGSKKVNTNYICVFSDNLCPYNFKLNAGLNYRASYCDSNNFQDVNDFDDSASLKRNATHLNAASCKEGLFSLDNRIAYKDLYSNVISGSFIFDMVKKDMAGYNDRDFETIYDINKITDEDLVKYYSGAVSKSDIMSGFYALQTLDGEKNAIYSLDLNDEIINRIKTSAYGQTKNFCQYRAHCVEVEKEEDRDTSSTITSTFLDSSCNASSTNSRNIQRSSDGTILKQLSVPIVECIHESLNNLINGVSGISSCKNSDLNTYGYCGTDTEEEVKENLKSNNMAFFEGRYNTIENSDGTVSYLIKGEELPEKFNPFLKIQNNFKDIIKIALTVFLVIFAYSALFSGKFESIINGNDEERSALMIFIFKFAIVMFLIFNNGWQKGIYNYILNFATAGYDFVNTLFISVINSPKSEVLNLNNGTIIKLVEENNITKSQKDVYLCYRYDIYNNAYYRIRDLENGGCGSGGFKTKLNSSEIYIKKNVNFPEQTENNLIISKNQEIQQLLYTIDNYNKENQGSIIKIKYKNGNEWVEGLNNSPLWNKEYDGCYFDTTEYKEGKSYLAFFDTIDCKMIRYLGYSVGNAVPNLILYSVLFLVPQYFFPNSEALSKVVSTVGGVLFGLITTFIFLMFNFIVKAVFTFLSSFFVLSILIFISPIVLPLMFFKRTKKIFDSWLENIIGLIFKPMFNIAFLVLYINIMDIMLMDGITFTQHSEYGRDPNVICNENSFSFYCIVNKSVFEMFDVVLKLFDGYFITFLTNVIIAFLFFKLADSLLDELNNLVSKIFGSLMTDSSGFAGVGGAVAGDKTLETESAFKSSMDAGNKLESFRSTYIQGSAYALGSGINSLAKNAVNLRYDSSSDFKKLKKDFNNTQNERLGLLNTREDLIKDNEQIRKNIKEKKKELMSSSNKNKESILKEINSLEEKYNSNVNKINDIDNNKLKENGNKLKKINDSLSEIEVKRISSLSAVDSFNAKTLMSKFYNKIENTDIAKSIRKNLTIFSENIAGRYTLIGRVSASISNTVNRFKELKDLPSKDKLNEEKDKLNSEILELQKEINVLESKLESTTNSNYIKKLEESINKKKADVVDKYFEVKEIDAKIEVVKGHKKVDEFLDDLDDKKGGQKKTKLEQSKEAREEDEKQRKKMEQQQKQEEELSKEGDK